MDQFNLTIPAGGKIALVGHSGCGKSTLTNLLLRFYNVNSGEVLIDGKDMNKYDVHSLRQQCGYVMQEPVLFHADIKTNILFGKPDATDEEVYIAAKKANALQFIETDIEDLTPEQKHEKLNDNLVDAFYELDSEAYSNLKPMFLHFKEEPNHIKQIVIDLMTTISKEILDKA